MDTLQNSNPTVLDAADLPTRAGPKLKNVDDSGALYHIVNQSTQGLDPFESDNSSSSWSIDDADDVDELEIYDLISSISDPEHPISLGSLAVVSLPDISITPSLPNRPDSALRTVTVLITPTITHCSLATVIGLGVRVRLEQALPPRFRLDVRIKKGTHSTSEEVNKQLADKERVAAALENNTLMGVIGQMLATCQ